MAGLIKRPNGYYYIVFTDRKRTPQKLKFSLKTKNRREAESKRTKLELACMDDFDPWHANIEDIFTSQIKTSLTVHDAVIAFLLTKSKKAKSTQRSYRELLLQFARTLPKTTVVSHVTTLDIHDFIRNNTLSPATQFRRYGHMRLFFRYCQEQKLVFPNPFNSVLPLKKPVKIPKACTLEEMEAVCTYIEERYEKNRARGLIKEGELIWKVPALRFAFYTGLRPGEIARLKWRHIDEKKRLIYLLRQKNGKEGTIPLTDTARKHLPPRECDDYFVFRPPLSPHITDRNDECLVNNLSGTFRDARDAIGLPKRVNLYSLRHGFCTMLAEKGANPLIIMEAARHADMSTTMMYVHIANNHLRDHLNELLS